MSLQNERGQESPEQMGENKVTPKHMWNVRKLGTEQRTFGGEEKQKEVLNQKIKNQNGNEFFNINTKS